MNNPNKKRLRRTMMFLNAQKPGLIKDPYIYKADSLMLDLEDAVAENQKDVARFSLYHALKTIDYGTTEMVVRVNPLSTPYGKKDIEAVVKAGVDVVRMPKTETADEVREMEAEIERVEKEIGCLGRTKIMAAIESALGVVNAYAIATSATPTDGGTLDCPATVAHGGDAVCHAAAATGFGFSHFTGCDSASGSTCTLANVQGPRSVAAVFTPIAPAGVAIPVLAPWGVWLLAGLLGVLGLRRRGG